MNNYFIDFLLDPANDDLNAICIDDRFYTYRELKHVTSDIVKIIHTKGLHQKSIGVKLGDDIYTYAAIMAIWYTGNIYVPIHGSYPKSRVQNIIDASDMTLILSSSALDYELPVEISALSINEITSDLTSVPPYKYQADDIVYALFTSGSTGVPKGVQINYRNLSSFLENLSQLNIHLREQAGYLQMFELTFDLSIVSLLLPLMKKGVLFHVSSASVKYLEIYRLLEEYEIEFAIIVPSVLSMLRPYFNTIELPKLQIVGLSGEAVPLDLTQAWQVCCNNARFFNFYGPTECTIFCTYYEIPRERIAALNGIVSIGQVNDTCNALCLNEDGTEAEKNEKALLWIGGDQVSPGYLNNASLNNTLFKIYNGKRYYNTGDIVIMNNDDELFYLGRKDHQVKISGYRIEISEVEYSAEKALNARSVVVAVEDARSMMQLVLFTNKKDISKTSITEILTQSMPDYMVPSIIFQIDEFPLNSNGKLDRNRLKEYYDQQS